MGLFGNLLGGLLGMGGKALGGSLLPFGGIGSAVGGLAGDQLGGLARKITFQKGGVVMTPNGQMMMVVKKKKSSKKRKGKSKK
jgi:hypothetical protein